MSTSKFSALFKPLQIGTHTIPNRVGMSAMTRNRATSTYPTELMKEYFVQRTRGGTGIIVTDAILITRQGYELAFHKNKIYLTISSRTEWPNAPGIWDEKHVAGWKNVTDGVHQAGGKIFAQLWHRQYFFPKHTVTV